MIYIPYFFLQNLSLEKFGCIVVNWIVLEQDINMNLIFNRGKRLVYKFRDQAHFGYIGFKNQDHHCIYLRSGR